MRQAQILVLLQEASQANCLPQRRNDIWMELHRELSRPDNLEETPPINQGEYLGIGRVLDVLFLNTATRQPDRLIDLFPVIAVLCGDRDEIAMFAEVDWSLVPSAK